jgi:hypothetical protein
VSKHVLSTRLDVTTAVLFDIMKAATIFAINLIEPLPSDYDCSLETWLSKTSYTSKEKEKFRAEIKLSKNITRKDKVTKCFVKAETYPEYKFPRPIKSRTDRFKALLGPIFQGINEKLFSNTEWFIKKIPVNERPEFIKQKVGNSNKISCTDYTSFEAHFIDCMMYSIERPLYYWIIHKLPCANKFKHELTTLMETNICLFKDILVFCMSRASGEMNTSSGNGWSNLVLFLYLTTNLGAIHQSGSFEGDDSITSTTPSECTPIHQDYEDLGWNCKVEFPEGFSTASFCGIVADPDELINICDIKAYVGDFGWTRQQYVNASSDTIHALLRAKGYSAVYQYPNCPIIDSLGRYALRVTENPAIIKTLNKMIKNHKITDSRYKHNKFQELMKLHDGKLPPKRNEPDILKTRNLVAKIYNIDIQKQLEIEKYLDGLNKIEILDINIEPPSLWEYNSDNFVHTEHSFHELQQPINQIENAKKFFSQHASVDATQL